MYPWYYGIKIALNFCGLPSQTYNHSHKNQTKTKQTKNRTSPIERHPTRYLIQLSKAALTFLTVHNAVQGSLPYNTLPDNSVSSCVEPVSTNYGSRYRLCRQLSQYLESFITPDHLCICLLKETEIPAGWGVSCLYFCSYTNHNVCHVAGLPGICWINR